MYLQALTGNMIAPGGSAAAVAAARLKRTNRKVRVTLPGGEQRYFLEDGDRVLFRAQAQKEGLPRIGFGECSGTVVAGEALTNG